MLRVRFSNRLETLCDALVAALGVAPPSPFSAQQVVVPSTAMRRQVTLAVADRYGICANVDCVYLAQWLWRQIAKVVRTVAVDSPFASNVLVWRIYQLLEDPAWTGFYPRLANYLRQPHPVMRFELAAEIAYLFEQYITYRQDWMGAWLRGERIDQADDHTHAHRDDQEWQAELWRRIGAHMGADQEHPANRFFRCLETSAAAGANPFDLPETVHVFCLPAMPPLYLEVLTGLARWVDVTIYALNPCREYWFDIVDPKRLQVLALRGAAAHHETGNRLLASWGRQTRAYLELLLDRAENAPVDDSGFDEQFPATMLGQLQAAIFNLAELAPASLVPGLQDRSIEVHVCHSLTRELEVLQDQLLALFAGPLPPQPDDILIVTPDIAAAAPLIDAVFGNVPEERRLPYVITGRGRSAINAAAHALLALLAMPLSRFPASALIDLLRQPLIGRRFRIAADELPIIQEWIRESGIRWGIDAAHRLEHELPGTERFTVMDGLDRLLLGYALPERVSAPAFGRIPAGNAEGSRAQILGSFAGFVAQLLALRENLRDPRLPDAWYRALLDVLDTFLAPDNDAVEALGEVRETLRELHGNMCRGGLATPVPLAVVRAALESLLDDPARGGVPTGSITFASMSSLRNLPFRVVGIIGLGDGAFPGTARPREFDLMAAQPRAGDRQRGVDDRNLFLDLVLAARERLYVSYTGRSIRDNSVLPPSVVVAELIEALLPALAREPGAGALAEARGRLVIEHPLQPFAEAYFRPGDPRRRSFNRELCEALRHATAQRAAVTSTVEDALPDREAPPPNQTLTDRAAMRGVGGNSPPDREAPAHEVLTDGAAMTDAEGDTPQEEAVRHALIGRTAVASVGARAYDMAEDMAVESSGAPKDADVNVNVNVDVDADADADAEADADADADRRQVTRFFAAPLAAPGAEWQHVSLEQLLQFFRNPCRFLLRQRLGMVLHREDAADSDDEPFLPDFRSRQALAERLLPQAMQGLSAPELRRLAEAGIEYPPGTLGTVLVNAEMDLLQHFARTVRDATQAPCLPPVTIDLPFVLDGEHWRLASLLTERRPAGLLLHRYDDTRPSDYLSGWLTHLAAAAALPDPTQTQWISRDGGFRLTHCRDARGILRSIMMLYRRGLREPIHFFPKSAWAYIQAGRDLAAAGKKWHKTYGRAHGEDAEPAYRLALRGVADPLDADFQACAETVFGAIAAHLEDARL